jgi:hypothetical protein
MIRNQFVCGYKNIYKEPYAGNSGVHPMNSSAVLTTNGAGPHNVQIFVLSEDGTVLHCMPGYWNPEDLASELALAQKLNSVWLDHSISKDQKATIFKKMQLEHLALHTEEEKSRSHLQGFDAHYIAQHAAELPDLIEKPELLIDYKVASAGTGKAAEGMHVPEAAFKTTDTIMHERMSKTGFVAYNNFNVAAFTNYGTTYYDKNENESEGKVVDSRLKKMDLHKVTQDAIANASLEANSASSCKLTSAHSGSRVSSGGPQLKPEQLISELLSQHKNNEAFSLATEMIKVKQSNAQAWQLRATAAFQLKAYEQAYADATRAAWLGCRDASNADLRRNARQLCSVNRNAVKVAQK